MSSSLVPLKTLQVRKRCMLNLSRTQTSSRWCDVVARRGVPAQMSSSTLVHGSKLRDYNDDDRDEITDFVESIPGFQECNEDLKNLDGNRYRRLSGFKMLKDDEIVTSVQAESDRR
ncbi:hypothetical protein TNCV_1640331 [Trichonephila clavipes]|nr:hypothetical protein TNCV_1640331 [Trichonephila clavipes]